MVQCRFNLTSIDDLVHRFDGKATFVEMSASWHEERCPLSFVAGANVDRFCSAYFQDPSRFAPRGFYSVKNASIIADGIVIQGDDLLTGRSLMMADGFFPSIWTSPAFHDFDGRSIGAHVPEQRERLPGITVSLVSLGWQVYGHMLLDVLPRIERMIRSDAKFDRFLLGAPKQWHKDLVALTGLSADRLIFIDNNWTVVDCEELILPVIDRQDTELHPDVMNVYRRLKEHYNSRTRQERNIFISRREWGGTRTLENRADVEDAARAAGFEIVVPETMPLVDQMALFASARSVLGESGSGMHATLFCGQDVKVGVIQPWDYTNFLQSQIGSIAKQHVGYALGEPTGDERWIVDRDAVDRLAAFLLR